VIKLDAQADAAMNLQGVRDPSAEALGGPMVSWFVTPARGWLDVPRPRADTLWQTADGGRTWRQISNPLFSSFHFADASHGLAEVVTPDQRTALEITRDGGVSWTPCDPPYGDILFDSIFLLDAQRGWAVVSASEADWMGQTLVGEKEGPLRQGIMSSADGGCHWRPVWSSERQISDSGELYFLDEANGWLTGGHLPGLQYTSDGGHSWRPLRFPDEKLHLKAVFFQDLAHGWSITSDEQTYETADGGRTWRLLPRTEILSRLEELATAWGRWRIGKLYAMLMRAGCFTPEELKRQHRSTHHSHRDPGP
jgi:photosystem II stability/assembly factor-like uncharacterized protein